MEYAVQNVGGFIGIAVAIVIAPFAFYTFPLCDTTVAENKTICDNAIDGIATYLNIILVVSIILVVASIIGVIKLLK